MRKPFEGNYTLTQAFGGNASAYAQFGMKGHNGLDYATPTGTDILAPHSGKVIEVAYDPTGYGTYIKIENDKEGSVLAHLKESHISVGDNVSEGQLIAKSDNTGNSTGPHLHWGYYTKPRNRQNGYAGFINQLSLFSQPTQPVETIESLKKQIADLKETEKRLIKEKDEAIKRLEKESLDKLALAESRCLIRIKDEKNIYRQKIISFAQSQ